MSDIVPYERARSLVTWAQEADAAYKLAERMVDTSFCPVQFKGKPVEAAAAVLAGAEVGLSPMAALRSFDIIQGVAAPRALTLRAVAQDAGCHFQTVEESERKVVMRAKRPGGEWETVTWTIERAQRLKLTGKDNWQKQPQAMLVARATAELARRVAADRILGLGYAAEEQDVDDAPGAKRTVSRRSTPKSDPASGWDEPKALEPGAVRNVAEVDLPPLPGEAEATISDPDLAITPEPPRRPPGTVSPHQTRMMFSLLRKSGINDRDLGLAFYADVIGREVESSKELTPGEVSAIIDRLLVMTADAVEDVPHPAEFAE